MIPGWASDYRIFDSLDLNFNYLIPLTFSFSDFEQKLLEAIKGSGRGKISLLGWSLGSFLAADFSAKFPKVIDQLILVGIRSKYPSQQLFQIRTLLKRNQKAYLGKFYQQCFFQKEKFVWFKENFMKAYLEDFKLESLLSGLDYLEKATLDTQSLKALPRINIIHGQNDKIAPLAEAKAIKETLPQAEFIAVEDTGHAAFLEADIARYL